MRTPPWHEDAWPERLGKSESRPHHPRRSPPRRHRRREVRSVDTIHSLAEAMRMKREFSVVIERDSSGYYVASVPALPGCHTQAKSLDKLMQRIKDAIELYVEEEDEVAGGLNFVGIQQITVERLPNYRP